MNTDTQARVDYIEQLLQENRNEANANQMKAYMKDHFDFYGVKSPTRKILVSEYWTACKQKPDDSFKQLIDALWNSPYRESQYFAMDLIQKVQKHMDESWLEMVEDLVTRKSWWDSVDFLASNPLGVLLKKYPSNIDKHTTTWMAGDNMWLQRCCLLYQLKYKSDVNFEQLTSFIERLKGGKEFFINKAIGWSLRQYSKVEPDAVRTFLEANPDLSNLSKREASKYL